MSSTQTESIELTQSSELPNSTAHESSDRHRIHIDDDAPTSAFFEAIPDGGYGWTVVFACSAITFMINGWSGSWGVFQAAILQAYPDRDTTTSLSFVGSLSIGLVACCGLICVKLSQLISARYTMLVGVLMMGIGMLLSGFTADNLGGLFVTAGALTGVGSSLTYSMSNSVPVQWFSGRLGTANGLVKLGGGLGATIMAIVIQALIEKVGIPWTFRIVGGITLASGIPAALLIRERAPSRHAPFVDTSLFKSLPFCGLFLAGAVGTFALFVPPFFLPLFAHSIGLSPSTGAGIVAAFNACGAIGRMGAGFACDRFGSTNSLLLTVGLNGISMLAIWPVSNTIGLLVVFAALNGIANGAFFVTMPTAVGRLIGPGQAAVGMGMAVTGWTGGYFMGSPIAGMLIAASGAEKAQDIGLYRGAIFYAGGIALASATFVLMARLKMDTNMKKKL